MSDNKKLWDDAMIEIEMSVSKANFSTWFKNTFISKQDDNVIYLSVPNAFVKDWLLNKYHKFVLKALRNISPSIRGVEYLIQKEEDRIKDNRISDKMRSESVNQLKFTEIYSNKEDNLNPKYMFESFIVGPFNELAYAAAQAVIKNPGTNYNPLYVYGGTGLGKTHLIQAVGNHLKKHTPNTKVYYLTSERYITELVNSISNNTIHIIKEKYKKYDALIIDDVQFFSGKDKLQEEIFHLFNHFHDMGKQIVFSSDKPPKSIEKLEERLRSRFEGGMVVDISKPDYESRLAILNSKIKTMGFDMDSEVMDYVASMVQENIRELEGVLNIIYCQTQVKNRNLTVQEVKNLIKNNTKQQKTISFKDVIKTVSDFYNIDEKHLHEKTRRREVVKPRQIAMFILREDMNSSYPFIGEKFGGRDHTTVIHACEKIKGEIKTNEILNREIDQIKNILFGTKPHLVLE